MVRARSPRNKSLAAAIVLALSITAAAAADPKAARLYEDALKRFDAQDMGGAIIQLKNAIKIDRDNLAAQLLLGRALLAKGEVIAAEVAFGEALRLGVDRVEVVVPLARAVIAQGRPGDVIKQPRFAGNGLPATVQAQLLLVRASAQGDTGDAAGAFKSIEEARALDPRQPEAYLAEVPIRILMRQFREAEGAAAQALALSGESAQALYLRGSVAHAQMQIEAALGWYARALAAQPTHVEALVARAGLQIDRRDLEAAARDVATLRKASPREPRAAYLQALLAERNGQPAAARAALSEVTALLDPVPLDFLRYRPQLSLLNGLAHFGLQELEKARPYLEMAQRNQPASPVSKLLAQVYLANRNIDRAIESLEPYLRAVPDDAAALMLLASAQTAQGRHARAAQLAQEALKLEDAPAAHATLGFSLAGSGKVDDAVRAFERAFSRDPKQLEAGTALVMLHLYRGQNGRAIEVAQALVAQQPQQPGLHNLLGLARARNADLAGARAAFAEAARLDAKFSAAQVNLARVEIENREYDAAARRLAAVLLQDDKNVEAAGELGVLHERRGQAADAQRWFEKANDHAGPQQIAPGLALVEFHLRQGRADAARDALKRVSAKAPDNLQVLLLTARVALANADAAAARSSLSRAAQRADYDPSMLVRIALLQLRAGHPEGAAYSLQKAAAEDPNHLPSQALLADVELQRGDVAGAERRARQIVAKHPKQGVGHALLGDVARARKDTAGAVDHYRRAHQLDASSASLLRLHGALALQNAAAAAELAEQWLKVRPGDVEVRRALADGHAGAGRYAAARAGYEALLAQAPDDVEALNNLANALILIGQPEPALRYAQQALDKQPSNAHVIGTAGWAFHHNGQAERALQLLRDARLRDPRNPQTRYFLGVVLAKAGRNAEAREELEVALRSERTFASTKDASRLLETLR